MAAPPRTPYFLLRISIARPFRTTKSSAKTIDGSLPGCASRAVLDENYGRPQCQKMVRRGDLMGREVGVRERTAPGSALRRYQPIASGEHQMGVETEIKFRMPNHNRGASARLTVPGCKIGKRSESDLLSTYFDTRKHKLKRRGLLLRVRQTDGKHIQTIKKTSGAQFGRGEWETEIAGRTPDLDEGERHAASAVGLEQAAAQVEADLRDLGTSHHHAGPHQTERTGACH